MTATSRADLEDILVAAINERWCSGFQIACSGPDGAVHRFSGGVDGLGNTVDHSSMWAIYCAGKPITALAVAMTIADGELSRDDRLGDVIESPLSRSYTDLTIADLLSHRAGVSSLGANMFLGYAQADLDAAVRLSAPPPATPRFGYSEFVGWELLRLAVEDAVGEPFDDFIAERVSPHLGGGDNVTFRLPTGDARRERLRLNLDLNSLGGAPLLWESSDVRLSQVSSATGAITTMDGLHSLYRNALDGLAAPDDRGAIHGLQRPLWSWICTPSAPPAFDPILERTCSFGHGVMTNLTQHDFSVLHSAASFGHSGLFGMTVGGADPLVGVAYAIHLNAVTPRDSATDPARSPQQRRRQLVDAVLQFHGAAGTPPEPSHV